MRESGQGIGARAGCLASIALQEPMYLDAAPGEATCAPFWVCAGRGWPKPLRHVVIARPATRRSHNLEVAISILTHGSACGAHAEAFAFGPSVPWPVAEVPSPQAALFWRLLVGRCVLAPTRRRSPHPLYFLSRHLRSRSAAGRCALQVSPCRRRGGLIQGHFFPATWPRGVTACSLDCECSDRGSNPREALPRAIRS